ncbi:MAG: hypothetical protein J6B30_00910 [Muribaculaceae bacterium]|nr:hypothetical protein [Muribaculaceae bacterium]MBR3830490.1 hypothetical protein [Muribaculaceae bacterium]
MQSSKFNFATVLSIIVLLVFSYITFLGLVYWQNGDFIVAGVLTGILFVLGVFSVYFLTASAESRWGGIRLWGQIGFGSVTFILLMVASFPFTNFLRVSSDSEILGEKITDVYDATVEMDSAYSVYVTNRVDSFRIALNNIVSTKSDKQSTCITGAHGATVDEKINSVTSSLKNRLLPEEFKTSVKARQKWLKESSVINPWNPQTPSNLATIGDKVAQWKKDYNEVSKVAYSGEAAGVDKGFEYDKIKDDKLNNLNEEYSGFGTPNAVSIICALVCFGFIMLPFFAKKKDRAGVKRTNDGKNLFTKRESQY